MNLYIECSKVLHKVLDKSGSIKKLVYSSDFDNKKHLYGLVCETLKYGSVLQQILDNTGLLEKEKLLKKDRLLAHALIHDFVFEKRITRAGKLKQTIQRHKTEIFTECERLTSEAGVDSLYDLLPQNVVLADSIPRYVRVNLLKTSVEAVIQDLVKEGWQIVDSGSDSDSFMNSVAGLEKYQFMKDFHLFDVIVFPPGTDFHDNQLFESGSIILQDKASCFPAHVLMPPEGAHVIDCCAAPGNKTSHMASLMQDKGKIFAFDKDGRRMATLQYLTSRAGVKCITGRCQDFLKVKADDETFADVEYILVDPSCSGSGIVSRLNQLTDDEESVSKERLKPLTNFQVTILKHVLKFPKVKRVVYSTCSVHPEENECVVNDVLSQVSEEFELCKIFPEWPERGCANYENYEYFLRMTPEKALTNGFFVACFVRKENSSQETDITERTSDTVKSKKKKKHKHKERKDDSEEDLNSEKKKKKKNRCDENEEFQTESKHTKKKKRKMTEAEDNRVNGCDLPEESIVESVTSSKKKHKKKKRKMTEDVGEEGRVNGHDLVEGSTAECVTSTKTHKKKTKSKHRETSQGDYEHITDLICEEDSKSIQKKKKKKSKS